VQSFNIIVNSCITCGCVRNDASVTPVFCAVVVAFGPRIPEYMFQ
jgi:hypothetical protein